jgi:hypothetical protein
VENRKNKWFTGILLAGLLPGFFAAATEPWQEALNRMPLETAVRELNRTNCVEIMLRAFQSNQVVKGLIFMPGATDEFYMFRRAKAELTNASPTLLDAVAALTNQTLIKATMRPPLLLLHTDEDQLEPLIRIEHAATMEKVKQRRFLPHAVFNDRAWEILQPLLSKRLKIDVQPWRYSYDSWHFYRASLAAWDLSGPETLEAIALACKATVTVRWKQLVVEPDMRIRATPSEKVIR